MKTLIRNLLAPFPEVRSSLRRTAQYARFGRRCRTGMEPGVAEGCRLRRIDADTRDGLNQAFAVFFGYYDKTPWSPDGSLMLMHRLSSKGADTIEIGMADAGTLEWRRAATSRAWSYQQGSMTQWLPGSNGRRIVYNDVEAGTLVSRILTVTGRREACIPYPVQAVHPAGRTALSLNYRRLARLRPEYGYAARVDNFQSDMDPDRDGLWQVDLETGEASLISSLCQLAAFEPRRTVDPHRSKVNHAMFSPTGARFVFMFRWFEGPRKSSRLFAVHTGTGAISLVLDEEYISHYSWIDDERLLLYARPPGGAPGYFTLNVLDGRVDPVGKHGLDAYGDGHPTLSPDRTRLTTDTYPDPAARQHLLMSRPDGRDVRELAVLFHPPQYHGITRCDLHPRWSPDGSAVSFDSVTGGRRRSYVLDPGDDGF